MARRPISVYQLNQYIKRSIETDPVLRDVAVHGEISRITFQKNGYVYFDLKDERSSVSCAIWSDIPDKDKLASGKEVTVYGRLSVYDVRGTYTIAVNGFDLAGEGDLAIAFAKLKK
jgi:exodeoxyribonuclease VII large subunit